MLSIIFYYIIFQISGSCRKWVISAQFHSPLVSWKTIESVAIKIMEKVWLTERANVENIANVGYVEYIRNVDPEQFANIKNKMFEVFEEMEIDFEEIIMEEVLFD